MAEIEDEGAGSEFPENCPDAPVECGTARHKQNRIEIALHRNEGL